MFGVDMERFIDPVPCAAGRLWSRPPQGTGSQRVYGSISRYRPIARLSTVPIDPSTIAVALPVHSLCRDARTMEVIPRMRATSNVAPKSTWSTMNTAVNWAFSVGSLQLWVPIANHETAKARAEKTSGAPTAKPTLHHPRAADTRTAPTALTSDAVSSLPIGAEGVVIASRYWTCAGRTRTLEVSLRSMPSASAPSSVRYASGSPSRKSSRSDLKNSRRPFSPVLRAGIFRASFNARSWKTDCPMYGGLRSCVRAFGRCVACHT